STSTSTGTGTTTAAIAPTTNSETNSDCEDSDTWAAGGTAALTATRCYPDPFAAAVSECALYCETTAGPCTAATLERQDISEGLTGLPVRLALKLVELDTCAPLASAKVEIWHTQRAGIYSGVTPAGAFCFGDDPDATEHLYFRGTQTSDAAGRVD